MSKGSLNPVAHSQLDTGQTDRQTDRVTTEGTISGFQDFFLQHHQGSAQKHSICINQNC